MVTLYKNNKEDIKLALDKQSMMKAERLKLYTSLDEMSDIKIAGIAGNQRKRFVEILFKSIEIENNKNVVFFDDSVFSGYTFLAAQHQLKKIEHTNIILFDKTDDNKD